MRIDIAMKRTLLAAILFIVSQISYAEIYKWVDDNGRIHYSDKKPANRQATDVELKPENIFEGRRDSSEDISTNYKKDSFRVPYRVSKIPYRFIMTSAMNVDEPADRLSSININMKQKSFYSYIKLTGVDSGVEYKLRIRVIDAKGELIFDKGKIIKPQTNSLWFAARVTPKINIDEPGDWTIQAILNNERLFVEKRRIKF